MLKPCFDRDCSCVGAAPEVVAMVCGKVVAGEEPLQDERMEGEEQEGGQLAAESLLERQSTCPQ